MPGKQPYGDIKSPVKSQSEDGVPKRDSKTLPPSANKKNG